MISALAVLACSVVTAGAAGPGPRMEIEEEVWDFGSVTNQQTLAHDFLVRNTGDAPLEITRVVSSCEVCLSAAMETRSIPPGGDGWLHCQLDLRRLAGKVNRTVTLSSNDGRQPSLVVTLTGKVVPLFEITPAEIYLDLATGPRKAVAQILPLGMRHASLSRVQLNNTNMIARISEPSPGRFTLEVEPLASLPAGRSRFEAKVVSTDPADPVCLVAGVVDNPLDLEVIPPVLELRATAAPQTRIIWLRQRGDAPLALLDVLAPSDKFQATIEPDQAGLNYRILVVAWDQEAAAGTTNQVVLKMRDPANHERLIPVPVKLEAADSSHP